MKYDEKYKMKGVEAAQINPSIMYTSDFSGSCWECGDETNWMDIDFQAYICSTECHEAKLNEYGRACMRGEIWAALDEVYVKVGEPPVEQFSIVLREWVLAQLKNNEKSVEL